MFSERRDPVTITASSCPAGAGVAAGVLVWAMADCMGKADAIATASKLSWMVCLFTEAVLMVKKKIKALPARV